MPACVPSWRKAAVQWRGLKPVMVLSSSKPTILTHLRQSPAQHTAELQLCTPQRPRTAWAAWSAGAGEPVLKRAVCAHHWRLQCPETPGSRATLSCAVDNNVWQISLQLHLSTAAAASCLLLFRQGGPGSAACGGHQSLDSRLQRVGTCITTGGCAHAPWRRQPHLGITVALVLQVSRGIPQQVCPGRLWQPRQLKSAAAHQAAGASGAAAAFQPQAALR